MEKEKECRMLARFNDIKARVWKLSRSQREKRPTISDFIRLINDSMVELGLELSWDIIEYQHVLDDDGTYECFGSLMYTVWDVESGYGKDTKWFVDGSGGSRLESFHAAMTGAKEIFLLHFFDVPLKEIDPAAMIRAEYEERENERKAKLKKILDQIHVKVQQTLFEKPEMRKQIDDIVMQFARVNGRPSASYYAITTLEVAEALQDHIDKLLAP